jgi:hypothetical protein
VAIALAPGSGGTVDQRGRAPRRAKKEIVIPERPVRERGDSLFRWPWLTRSKAASPRTRPKVGPASVTGRSGRFLSLQLTTPDGDFSSRESPRSDLTPYRSDIEQPLGVHQLRGRSGSREGKRLLSISIMARDGLGCPLTVGWATPRFLASAFPQTRFFIRLHVSKPRRPRGWPWRNNREP